MTITYVQKTNFIKIYKFCNVALHITVLHMRPTRLKLSRGGIIDTLSETLKQKDDNYPPAASICSPAFSGGEPTTISMRELAWEGFGTHTTADIKMRNMNITITFFIPSHTVAHALTSVETCSKILCAKRP